MKAHTLTQQQLPSLLLGQVKQTRGKWRSEWGTWKKDTCYHGNAGIASAFAGLAHRKIKPSGVLALVLPLSATVGQSWQGLRKCLRSTTQG